MRVGVDRTKYFIHIPLPAKIDPTVTMMTVEEKPDVTYADVGGSKEVIMKLREVVELPLLHPEKFVQLGIDPPKGVLCYGPPGTGKTLLARAVANRTDACFIRVIGSELVQKYVGEGARLVRELFQMARSKKGSCWGFPKSRRLFCRLHTRQVHCLPIQGYTHTHDSRLTLFFSTKSVPHFLRRDRRHRRRALRRRPRRRQRGSTDDVGNREPAGWVRRARKHQSFDGHEQVSISHLPHSAD